MKNISSVLCAFAWLVMTVMSSGCRGSVSLIDRVDFTVAENLETIRVSLVFEDSIRPEMAGGFTLGEYGYLFVSSHTESQPFLVGFDLDTDVTNEQDYVDLEPTSVLPNGLPLGTPYPVVEVRAPDPVSDTFDLYAYIDVPSESNGYDPSWLGVSAIFSFLSDEYFPSGLSLSQVFLRDDENEPAILGSVFGPTLSSDGTLERAGGITLLANVRFLIDSIGSNKSRKFSYYPEAGYQLAGPKAEHYRSRPTQLKRAIKRVAKGFNQSH